ncbi:unnamed protein product [Ilex paraguariensis]|uniref:Endonuclease/exonuclease/phosphatase domain-containing protein n=1 Tax=Ilex paraguariensis TaxID=185542 RepID=A0ABC8RM30_9AQUA
MIGQILANPDWRMAFPYAQVIHEIRMGSDHSPIVIDFGLAQKRTRRQFKFEFMWLESTQCEETIKSTWLHSTRGSNMFKVSRKLKFCCQNLKAWSKNKFGNNRGKLAELKKQLAVIQSKFKE